MPKSRPYIVVLDGHTLNPGDLSWSKIKALGHTDIYAYTPYEEIVDRTKDAEIILPNKAVLDRAVIEALPKLQFIGVTATGYNNVDLEAAAERGIVVSNAVGYSTPAVAQHVFALLLELTNAVGRHHQSVQAGEWASCRDFSYTLQPIQELAGKVMGIYGFGRIGQQVGLLAQAFGMQVIATHKHPERDARPGVRFVDFKTLLRESDVLSLHAPLNENNEGIMNASNIATMKPNAYLINTGRGGLIDELALKSALEGQVIAGAGLDVLSSEPPSSDHPLVGLSNCIITPHHAWASRDARARLMEIVVENICAFLNGKPQNVVGE